MENAPLSTTCFRPVSKVSSYTIHRDVPLVFLGQITSRLSIRWEHKEEAQTLVLLDTLMSVVAQHWELQRDSGFHWILMATEKLKILPLPEVWEKQNTGLPTHPTSPHPTHSHKAHSTDLSTKTHSSLVIQFLLCSAQVIYLVISALHLQGTARSSSGTAVLWPQNGMHYPSPGIILQADLFPDCLFWLCLQFRLSQKRKVLSFV